MINPNDQYGSPSYPTSGNPDNGYNDPTMDGLYNNGETENFHAYPQELTSQENSGHFIMFQAFKVEGITLDVVVDALRGATEQSVAIVGEVIGNTSDLITGVDDNDSPTLDTVVESIFSDDLAGSAEVAIADLDRKNSLRNRLNNQGQANNGFQRESKDTDILGMRKELQETIALYMPNNLSATYSMDYSMENDLLATGVRSVLDLARAGKGASAEQIQQTTKDVGEYIANTGVNVGVGSMNLFGQDISGSISSLTRNVRNPHLEFLFKQVSQRAFTYTFNFFPRNATEMETVHNIVQAFKKYAHPVYDSSSTFLQMPSEFEIIFYSGGKENKYLNRILPCVLTNVEVNYTPNGQAAFFEAVDEEKGQSPTQIDLSLSFAEVGLLHRTHVEGGF